MKLTPERIDELGKEFIDELLFDRDISAALSLPDDKHDDEELLFGGAASSGATDTAIEGRTTRVGQRVPKKKVSLKDKKGRRKYAVVTRRFKGLVTND